VILNFTKIAATKIYDSRRFVTENYFMTVKYDSSVSFPTHKYFRRLFHDAVSDLGYIVSKGRMIHEGYCKVLSKKGSWPDQGTIAELPGETHKYEVRPNQASQ
jgi:hypothetical protein